MVPTRNFGFAMMVAGALLFSGCVGIGGQQTLPSAESVVGKAASLLPGIIPTDGPLKEFHLYVDALNYKPYEDGPTIASFAFKLDPSLPPTVPGPEIRVTEGDRVRVTLHDATHTVHWHGLSVPWGMDGVPFMTQTLGGMQDTFTYEFIAYETGTYWYHCHVDAPTHIDFGLFGALIVEPKDKAQDLPFDREYTLLLHDMDSTHAVNPVFSGEPYLPKNPADSPDHARRTVRDSADLASLIVGEVTGVHAISEGPREYYPLGSLRYQPNYDTFMINGKSFPETEPLYITKGETIRIRLINAGQLVHTMHLHGHKFLVTHKDGSNLPAPYKADTVLIAPGERYDLYVYGYNEGIWDFHDHSGMVGVGAYAANDHAFPGGINTMLVYEDFEYAQLPGPNHHTSGDYMVWASSYKGVTPFHGGHGRHYVPPQLAGDVVSGAHLH